MKKKLIMIHFALLVILPMAFFSGCRRSSNEVWEDTKTASRHVNRGVCSLAGKHGDSRAVRCKEDFYPCQEMYSSNMQSDFVPLADYQNPADLAMAEFVTPQPREIPGDPGSSVPGIEAFRDPSMSPELARIFRPIRFDYNSNLVKGDENLDTLRGVTYYMKTHPNAYIFVEGHCDERGPEAYNLSLGARRSNAIRNLLITDGVDPDRIFTISYGKERPLIFEHHEEAWAQNRRAEFKIYLR